MSGSKRLGFLLTSLMVGLLAMPVLGQDQNNGGQNNGGQNNGGGQNDGGQRGGGGGGGFRGRGGFNPQAMMDFYKQQLGASDDEFAAIQPKIDAVMQLQRDANSGRGRGFFGGRGGRGGPRGGGPGGPASTQPSPVADALQDLRTTLDDQSASPDTIKAKLEALRQARTKNKQDLAVAQQDLKSVLTQRQEAVMVLLGLLD